MRGYYINAYQVIEKYFERKDLPVGNNVNLYIDRVIRGERRISSGSTRVPFKRYFRNGVDAEFGTRKLMMPSEIMMVNLVSDEYGNIINHFIQGRYIIFNKEITIDCVVLKYEGMALDDNGYPLVPSTHEEVLIDYLEYEDLKVSYIEGKTPRYIYKDIMDELDDKILDIRALDMMPDAVTEAEVNIINNSLIPGVFINEDTFEEEEGMIIIDKSKDMEKLSHAPSYFGLNIDGSIPSIIDITIEPKIDVDTSYEIIITPNNHPTEHVWIAVPVTGTIFTKWFIVVGNEGDVGYREAFELRSTDTIINGVRYEIYIQTLPSQVDGDLKLF